MSAPVPFAAGGGISSPGLPGAGRSLRLIRGGARVKAGRGAPAWPACGPPLAPVPSPSYSE